MPMVRSRWFSADSVYLVITYRGAAGRRRSIAMVPFLYVISTSLKETLALFHYPPEMDSA